MGDEGIARQLRQQSFDVGAGRESDQIDSRGGVRFHDHAADLVEQTLEASIGASGTDAHEQFILHEFRRGAAHAPRRLEQGRFPRSGAGIGGMAGQEHLDFFQFGDASKRPRQPFPSQEVIIAFQQVFQGHVDVFAADGAGDGGLDGRIQPDFDSDAGELVENVGQRRAVGLEPQSIAFQAEKKGPNGLRGPKKSQKSPQNG